MKTVIPPSKKTNMKQFTAKLQAGTHKGGLDLNAKLRLDGEIIDEFPGKSFVRQLAYDLHSLMHGGIANRIYPFGDYDFSRNQVDAASNTSPIRISIQNLFHAQEGDFVWVFGVRGNTNANGLRIMKNVAGDDYDLYELDGVTPVAGNGAYAGGGYALPCGYRDWSVWRSTDNAGDNYITTQGFWRLCIGTKNNPVSINDFGLHSRTGNGSAAGYFNESGHQITAQVTDKPTSRFSILKNFTNNSGADITVQEMGITRGTERSEDIVSAGVLLARDVFAAKTVPSGKTLSAEYEIITKLEPDTQDTDLDGTNGGFTDNFLNRLRVIAGSPSRDHMYYLNMAGNSGLLSSNARSNVKGWELGIRLGTNNKFVSTTDDALVAQVNHGEADGQLYHYGSNIESVVIDEANNKATFEINRIFENRGATAITVAELGLFGNATASEINSIWMYARTALDPNDQFTIQPGEFRMVRYTLEFVA